MSRRREAIYYIVGTIIFLISAGVYIMSAAYVIPASDDFSYADYIKGYGGHNWLGVSSLVKMFYRQFQGVFFGIAVEGYLDPVSRIGWSRIGIILIIVIVLFSVCIAEVVRYTTKTIVSSRSVMYIVTALWIWIILNVRVMKELLLWFTGACDYTVPVMTGLGSIFCLLKYREDNLPGKKGWILISAVLLFLTGGGSLQIAGYFCWVSLLNVIYHLKKKKSILPMGIMFAASFLGALVNVAAPGNYVRKTSSYERISMIKAGWYSIVAVTGELKRIFSETYIPVIVLVIVIILLIYMDKTVEEKMFHPIIVGLAALVGCLISTFPVCYGYGDSTLAARGYETLDVFIVLGLILFTVSLVNWAKRKEVVIAKGNLILIGIIILFFLGYIEKANNYRQIPCVQAIRQLMTGELKEYHREWNQALASIESTDETIVELEIPLDIYEKELVVMKPNLSENPEKWVNYSLAHLYGKEQVKLKIIEETEDAGEQSK